MRSAMMRQTVLMPCTPGRAAAAAGTSTRGAETAAGAGVATGGRGAAATSDASTAPPGPEPARALRSTPRSAANRRALGDAATRRPAAPLVAAAGDAFRLST